VAFSPDGQTLAATSGGGTRLWDVVSGRDRGSLHPAQDEGTVATVAFSPDGATLASGSSSGLIHLWTIATGRDPHVLCGHRSVTSVAFSPDGRTLASAGGEDGTARLWEVATGRERATLQTGIKFLFCVVFSPDGKTLAMSGAEGVVGLWDVDARREIATLRGHQKRVLGVVFSPDGHRLATAGEDGTTRLWDIATGLELTALSEPGSTLYDVTLSPDGRRLASAAYLGKNQSKVLFWDATEVTPEVRARREAGAMLRYLIDRVSSRAELRQRIEHDHVIPEDVREIALPQTELFWETRVLHHAESLVASLFKKPMIREEVMAAIRRDPGLDPEVRAAALQLAKTWPESALDFNNASWGVVARPDASATDYQRALRQAERACRIEPENGLYLNTLGVAQYRNGLYREALATLSRSNERNQDKEPSDLAFLVMVRVRLGQLDAARAELTKLHEAMKHLKSGANPDGNQAFLSEAEGLLLDASLPVDPFAP
jgi:tetratricopeptide (TPR) repeat protein